MAWPAASPTTTPPTITETTTVKVVLVGDSGVGKTSLALRYVKNTFQPFQEPTIGAAFLSKTQALEDEDDDDADDNDNDVDNNNNDNNNSSTERRRRTSGQIPRIRRRRLVHLKIWDTAGQERYQSLTPLYFRGAGAAVLVFDICRLHSFQTLRGWVRQAKQHSESMLLVVVGNKSDLADHRSIPEAEARAFAESEGAFYVEASAKDDVNVQQLFLELCRRAADALPPDPPTNSDDDPGRVDLSAAGGYANSSRGGCCSSSSPSFSTGQSETIDFE